MNAEELIRALEFRLSEVQRAAAAGIKDPEAPDVDDAFDLGIDCRLANEEMWLNQLLVRARGSL